MIRGESFVYYGPEAWRSMWRNRHQLLTRLAACNQVVYVEPRPYLEQVLVDVRRPGWPVARSVQEVLRSPRLEAERPNLWVYHPPQFAPLGGPGPIRAASHVLRRSTLRRDLAGLGIDAGDGRGDGLRRGGPIVWISSPTQHDARLDLGARLKVYHIVDDYLAYHDLQASHRQHFAERERELIDWADLVVAVSPELIASKGEGNPKFRLLPNGFDASAYASDAPVVTPDALAELPRPIVGYVGLISVRLDLRLLDRMAAAHPEWTVVLMGTVYPNGCEDALSWLSSRPNVRILPAVPGNDVANYVRSFDVGLVPYRVTQETFHASPLKVYEYLAAGLPVVSADVPGSRQFERVVAIASSQKSWEDAIEAGLACNSPEAAAARRAAVAPHTWNARVETLSGYLAEALS